MQGNKPFEDALKNFKPERKFDKEEKKAEPSDTQNTTENSETPAEVQKDSLLEQERMEDDALFAELVQIFALKESDRPFYKIRKVITDSRKYSVTFDVNRYLSWRAEEMRDNPRVREIMDLILKRGYVAEAVNWLKSTTPAGMKYGTGSKDLRLENARKFAKDAGVSLEELAKQHKIKIEG